MKRFEKGAGEKLPFARNWKRWLAQEGRVTGGSVTVSNTAVVITPSGITVSGEAFADGVHSFWLEGGASGTDYTVTSRVTTASGHVAERAFTVRVVAVR